jgi:hypothetical protein
MPTALTDALLGRLQHEREHLVATLDGLSEYDVRRPVTPSGTNLLGLVKHVASVELGYLGESREWLLCVYRQSWAHADQSVRSLGLEAPATVSWWSVADRRTTVGHLVVRMVAETAHHAGHAERVREAIVAR